MCRWGINYKSIYLGLVDSETIYEIMPKEGFLKFNNVTNHDRFMDAVKNVIKY